MNQKERKLAEESEAKRRIKLAEEVRKDFESRKEARRNIEQGWRINMNLQKLQLLMRRAYREALHGSAVLGCWYIGAILPKRYSGQMIRKKSDRK